MVPFDTLAYVEALEAGGINRKLAEGHARGLATLLTQFIRHKDALAHNNIDIAEINKKIMFDILQYTTQLIDADEKPVLALTHAKMLAEHLVSSV